MPSDVTLHTVTANDRVIATTTINLIRPTRPAQRILAVEFLVANFFERGIETRKAKGVDCVDALIGVCAFRTDGWSVLYREFESLAAQPGALSAGARARLPIIWDDIAMSQDSADAWAGSFTEENFGQSGLTADEYVTEYWREGVPGAGEPNPDWGGANNDPDIDGSDWIDPERVPGLITVDDMQRVALITELFQLFSEQADEIDVAWSFLFIENDEVDGERGLDDLEAYIANTTCRKLSPLSSERRFGMGLYDDTLTFDEVVGLFNAVGTTLSLATLAVVTGGGSVGLLALAAAAAEGTAVAVVCTRRAVWRSCVRSGIPLV